MEFGTRAGIKGRVMEMTKTDNDQVIKLPDFVMAVLRWHVDKQLTTRKSPTSSSGASRATSPSKCSSATPPPAVTNSKPPSPASSTSHA
jgi:hypothetical protein